MGRDFGGYGDQWDDDETSGQPCAVGRYCAEADYAGNPKRGPRPFCWTDTARVGTSIRALPELYVELHGKLPKATQQGDERVTGGGKEAPVPIDLAVQALMRHIVLVTVSWEEAVRTAARLSDLPDGAVRDGTALGRACHILAGHDQDRPGHLAVLLALGPETVNRPVKRNTLVGDLPSGALLRVDTSGDAWQKSEADGTAAGLEFLALHSEVRGKLGYKLQTRRVLVPCDGCGAYTLKQRESLAGDWEELVRCADCGYVYFGQEYTLLIGREYDAARKAERAS